MHLGTRWNEGFDCSAASYTFLYFTKEQAQCRYRNQSTDVENIKCNKEITSIHCILKS